MPVMVGSDAMVFEKNARMAIRLAAQRRRDKKGTGN